MTKFNKNFVYIKKPDDFEGPESSEVSKEGEDALGIKEHIEVFTEQLTQGAISKFWQNRPLHPELNGNGVDIEDLMEPVEDSVRGFIAKHSAQITALTVNSTDPEKAFEDLTKILESYAEEAAEKHYETLVLVRKMGLDELTGLPNRKVFNANMKTAIERNLRYGEPFSFVIFDLDHFKEVNDTYGHHAGDEVLKEMARRLSEDTKLRKLDSLARYGGEEFVVLLPGTPKEGAAILAQRIADQIGQKPYVIMDNQGEIVEIDQTASIGIAEFTDAVEDPHGNEVLKRADSCLYILKGKQADAEGITEDRRGKIACEGRVLSREMISKYQEELSRSGRRSSRPPQA